MLLSRQHNVYVRIAEWGGTLAGVSELNVASGFSRLSGSSTPRTSDSAQAPLAKNSLTCYLPFSAVWLVCLCIEMANIDGEQASCSFPLSLVCLNLIENHWGKKKVKLCLQVFCTCKCNPEVQVCLET